MSYVQLAKSEHLVALQQDSSVCVCVCVCVSMCYLIADSSQDRDALPYLMCADLSEQWPLCTHTHTQVDESFLDLLHAPLTHTHTHKPFQHKPLILIQGQTYVHTHRFLYTLDHTHTHTHRHIEANSHGAVQRIYKTLLWKYFICNCCTRWLFWGTQGALSNLKIHFQH